MLQTRQLAAIMFTDIVGYTALMGEDEQKAFQILNKNRDLQKPIIEKHNGRWIKELGDGVMASFNTVSDAVYAAQEIQQQCKQSGEFSLRIGIHQGEIVFENDDVFGDAVNVASRIQAIAPVGGILISETIYHDVANKADIQTRLVKAEKLKNVREPVKIYEVVTDSPSSTVSPVKTLTTPLSKKRKVAFLTLFGLLLVFVLAVYFVYTRTSRITPTALVQEESDKSIAVLPFVNMSNDKEQEYFSDGMMEEILNQLSQISELKVTSRTSSMRYKESELSLKEIAKELGVANIVEGSVRKSGNKVRITVQLIDARSDKHLWSETFDREMQDIFSIQTDIATQIAAALETKLSSEEQNKIAKRSTENTEAYQLYLQGRYYWNKRSKEALKTSIKFFQQAIAKDSMYALAYAGIGDSYLMFGVYEVMHPRECFPIAKKYIERALQLDNSLAEAYATLIDINIHYDWDVEKAENNFRKSIRFNANYAYAYHWHSEVLVIRREFEKAIEASQLALNIEPYSLVINNQLGTNLIFAGELHKAVEQIKKTLTFDSTFGVAHYFLGVAYTASKQFDNALMHFRRGVELDPSSIRNMAALAYIEGFSGNRTEAVKIEQDLLKAAIKQYVPAYHLAVVELGIGRNEEALNYLEQAFTERSPWMPFVSMNPLFNSLKGNARFKALVEKIENSPL